MKKTLIAFFVTSMALSVLAADRVVICKQQGGVDVFAEITMADAYGSEILGSIVMTAPNDFKEEISLKGGVFNVDNILDTDLYKNSDLLQGLVKADIKNYDRIDLKFEADGSKTAEELLENVADAAAIVYVEGTKNKKFSGAVLVAGFAGIFDRCELKKQLLI